MSRDTRAALVAAIAIVVVIVLGFRLLGGPGTQRLIRYIVPSCYSPRFRLFPEGAWHAVSVLGVTLRFFSLWSLRLRVRILSSFLVTRRILIPHHLEPTCAALSHSSSS